MSPSRLLGLPVGRLGAIPVEPGIVEFRVWAPNARSVEIDGEALEPEGGGFHSARLARRAGDDYGFALDGGEPLADPCSRWQPEGLRGPSRVLDTSAFGSRTGRVALQLDTLVIYELHVGAFTAEGTFDAAARAATGACGSRRHCRRADAGLDLPG